jgi:hypothetical protein
MTKTVDCATTVDSYPDVAVATMIGAPAAPPIMLPLAPYPVGEGEAGPGAGLVPAYGGAGAGGGTTMPGPFGAGGDEPASDVGFGGTAIVRVDENLGKGDGSEPPAGPGACPAGIMGDEPPQPTEPGA